MVYSHAEAPTGHSYYYTAVVAAVDAEKQRKRVCHALLLPRRAAVDDDAVRYIQQYCVNPGGTTQTESKCSPSVISHPNIFGIDYYCCTRSNALITRSSAHAHQEGQPCSRRHYCFFDAKKFKTSNFRPNLISHQIVVYVCSYEVQQYSGKKSVVAEQARNSSSSTSNVQSPGSLLPHHMYHGYSRVRSTKSST